MDTRDTVYPATDTGVTNAGRRLLAGLALAAFAACGGGATAAPQQPAEPPPPSSCIAFSAYVDGYSPLTGPHPGPAVIDALLDELLARGDYRCIMTYGVLNGQDHVMAAARARGLTVRAILWLDGTEADEASVARGIELLHEFPDTITAVACGSELRVRHGAASAEAFVRACVARLRAAGVPQKIGTNDTWWNWCSEAAECLPWRLATDLDWLGVNVYAWWENRYSGLYPCTPAEAAAGFHVERFEAIRARYLEREVVLTEFGWPAGPDGYRETNERTGQRCGVASEANQELVIRETIRELRARRLSHVVFSAFREPWKAGPEGPVGAWWGVLAQRH